HPRAVAALGAHCMLWGNSAAVLRRVRDPRSVADTLRQAALPTPAVAGPDVSPAEARGQRWLVKPLRSGGGHRVRMWRSTSRVPRGMYLQAFVDGTPGSVIFVAAGGTAVPLGVSRQLVGDPAFGADGFRYCGSILAASDDPQFPRGPRLFEAAS